MATEREVDDLAEEVAVGLQLDCGDQLLDLEELVYRATPAELEALRRQVLQKQSMSGFDDEGLVKRFVNATKPKSTDEGAGDNQSYFNCFQNQVMLPTVIDHTDLMPVDLHSNWLCVVCPEGTRVLVIASHKSTRVYDLEGTWICEHNTHFPGGSINKASQVDDDSECTILDCLYNNELEIYYVVDLLCWKGVSYYKYETCVRMATLLDKWKDIPTLKRITQTNPFRFYTLPTAQVCLKSEICSTIKRASYEMTGLLFYHKRALYLPGLSPLGVWLETSHVPAVLDIQVHRLELSNEDILVSRGDWKKNRYEMSPEQAASIHNSACHLDNHRHAQRNRGKRGAGHNGNTGYGGGQQIPSPPNFPFGHSFCPPFPNFGGGYMGLPGLGGLGHFDQRGFHPALLQQQHLQHRQPRQQAPWENKPGNCRNKAKSNDPDGMKKIMLSVPVPDDRPNWPALDRHAVMMSVSMEYPPENFEKEYVAVICPVAKRRIVVANDGWTCSYNKLLYMERKFQSTMPGGNVMNVQVMKNPDMCVLDCLHLKAERTFYILDLMYWKQQPYYESEAEFRFYWINKIEEEMDLTSIRREHEYQFKSLPRHRCDKETLYKALEDSPFKVDGIIFFHVQGNYVPGTSPNVMWVPPEDMEKVLGWKPPENILAAIQKKKQEDEEKNKLAAEKNKLAAKKDGDDNKPSTSATPAAATETTSPESTTTATEATSPETTATADETTAVERTEEATAGDGGDEDKNKLAAKKDGDANKPSTSATPAAPTETTLRESTTTSTETTSPESTTTAAETTSPETTATADESTAVERTEEATTGDGGDVD